MAKAEKYRLAQIVERFGGEILGDRRPSQVAASERRRAPHQLFTYSRHRGSWPVPAPVLIRADPIADLPSCRASLR